MRNTVNADKFGRDALADFWIVVWFTENRQTGVRMKVDEARANDFIVSVDHPFSFEIFEAYITSFESQGVVFDKNGTAKPRRPGAVDDPGVVDE